MVVPPEPPPHVNTFFLGPRPVISDIMCKMERNGLQLNRGPSPRLASLLESKILALDGVNKKKSRWMDRTAFYINRREFAHFHSSREIDVRLTRRYQDEYSGLIKEGKKRVKFREHPSHWISIEFTTTSDVDYVFTIVSLALRANRMNPILRRTA